MSDTKTKPCPKCHKAGNPINPFLYPICQNCVDLQRSNVYFISNLNLGPCDLCKRTDRPIDPYLGRGTCIDCWKPDHRFCVQCYAYKHLDKTAKIDGYRYCLECMPALLKKADEEYKKRQMIQLPTLYHTDGRVGDTEVYCCLLCHKLSRIQTHPYICRSCNDKLPEGGVSGEQEKEQEEIESDPLEQKWQAEIDEGEAHYQLTPDNELVVGRWYAFLPSGERFEDETEAGVFAKGGYRTCFTVCHGKAAALVDPHLSSLAELTALDVVDPIPDVPSLEELCRRVAALDDDNNERPTPLHPNRRGPKTPTPVVINGATYRMGNVRGAPREYRQAVNGAYPGGYVPDAQQGVFESMPMPLLSSVMDLMPFHTMATLSKRIGLAVRCSGQCKRHLAFSDLTARQIWSNPVEVRMYCADCSICYFGRHCKKGERCPFEHL